MGTSTTRTVTIFLVSSMARKLYTTKLKPFKPCSALLVTSHCAEKIVSVRWHAGSALAEKVGLNDTAKSLLESIRNNEDEVSPSTIFAMASVREGVRNCVSDRSNGHRTSSNYMYF